MRRVSLISNSGIQFYKFRVSIDKQFGKTNKIYFHEPLNLLNFKYWIDFLHKEILEGEEIFYRKNELIEKNFLNESHKIILGSDISNCKVVNENVFTIDNITKCIKHFKNKWIPLPYFKNNNINEDLFGPTDWIRLFISGNETNDELELILAIDTQTTNDSKNKNSPFLNQNPDENIFKLCQNDVLVSSFFDDKNNCGWIDDYIGEVFFKNNEDLRLETPYNQHIGNYFLLIRWLYSLEDLPEIQIYNNNSEAIDVDLVIDLGNSKTCALLFENPKNDDFNFNKVKKLKLHDFSSPNNTYCEPFSMNIVFKQTKFGEITSERYHNSKFIFPSFVRVGEEANRLKSQSTVELSLGKEINSYNSSPKRYLWDKDASSKTWEFYPEDVKKPLKEVYIPGISEQLTSNGELCKDSFFGVKPNYSRNSLMTFVFLEIISHANTQINSFEFRQEHGNIIVPRKLKRITISCPTGMIQFEQIELREAAENACKLIFGFNKQFNPSIITPTNEELKLPEIIPSIIDLKLNLSKIEDKKDWIYDEATSSQMVFLYGLLGKKMNENTQLAIKVFSKWNDKTSHQKLTIGSIDIGGGTTDLMICSHDINTDNIIKITPTPLFWESFKIAGDDLLKELIQQIIIEGEENEINKGACGVIENTGKKLGVENLASKLNGFFGEDNNNIGYKGKMMRKLFTHQIAIPIVIKYLENANKENENTVLTFNNIFSSNFNNVELLNYFFNHFGFKFEEIEWRLSSKQVNSIVQAVFEQLVKRISVLLSKYECDFVILSGNPCSLNSVEQLFQKYMAVTPDRLINLNNYWIGRWYPFSDNNGYINDPKTIVSVGSIISLMAGPLGRINNFRLNSKNLRNKLISTADNVGVIEKNNFKTFITPSNQEGNFNINSLPARIGFKKINSENYPLSDLYLLKFNDDNIEEHLTKRHQNAFNLDILNTFKTNLILKLPFTVNVIREIEKSKEDLKIESVYDFEGEEISKKFFRLDYQTLSGNNEYWLDNCEFILNIRTN
jgi:hypothetical protein